jgi:predicted AlkP superfamily pyrophosphatase or phosphodiesterase
MMNKTKNVLLVLVDGMRPDGLQQAETPTMDRLVASGSSTLLARTVTPSVSLPCITSLFLGVPPERHGITTNLWMPPARPVPGLMDIIQQSGGQAASFYNWEELRDLSRPGSLQAAFFLRDCYTPQSDTQLTDLAIKWLRDNPFSFAFVYLGYTDIAGHDHGWMSEQYITAISNADRCIARLLEVLQQDSLVVVTADHGGHDRTHGTDSPEDMLIPLILRGRGLPAGSAIPGLVSILDIAPTICGWLGIDPPREWAGKDLIKPT